MSQIMLVRQPEVQMSEEDKVIARRVIFGCVDGLGDKGKKQWRRFWNRLFKLEAGEMVELNSNQQRLGWYHRKHMALEQKLFESQERFDEFDDFRMWLKVGAGYVTWHPGAKGGIVPIPKSLAYSKLEQGEMETVHNDMVTFMRTPHALKTLWPHLTEQVRSEYMELVLVDFGE